MKFSRITLLAVTVFAVWSCQDLDVTNPNNPDRERALRRPGDVESLIGTQFSSLWGVLFGTGKADASTGDSCAMETCPAATLSVMADHFSSSWGNAGMRFLSIEPRTAFNNSSGYPYRAVNQFPWFELYAIISNVNDGLRAINGGLALPGPEAGDTSDAPRARAVAHLLQGMAHGYLALMFDSAFVHTEDLDVITHEFKLLGYQDVRDSAIKMIRTSIAIADASPAFTTQPDWFRGTVLNNADVSRLGHTMIARLMMYNARSVAERQAVDWNAVLTELNAGLQRTLSVTAVPGVFQGYWRYYAYDEGWTRLDMKTIGPADTSSGYATWIALTPSARNAFVVKTPDRRISNDTINRCSAAVTKACGDSIGSYFRRLDYSPFRDVRGTYHHSYYTFIRFGDVRYGSESGQMDWITKAEIDLMKAEAMIRDATGGAAGAAALINNTRVEKGGLAPVTAAGVVPGPGAGCVPRRPDGTGCGSLMDALIHEFKMEMAGMEPGIAFFQARGWGTLVPGTLLHFPLPGRELETLGKPIYTYGGAPGQPGSAP